MRTLSKSTLLNLKTQLNQAVWHWTFMIFLRASLFLSFLTWISDLFLLLERSVCFLCVIAFLYSNLFCSKVCKCTKDVIDVSLLHKSTCVSKFEIEEYVSLCVFLLWYVCYIDSYIFQGQSYTKYYFRFTQKSDYTVWKICLLHLSKMLGFSIAVEIPVRSS